jgi:hypothetical protein
VQPGELFQLIKDKKYNMPKYILGLYDDDEKIVEAAKKIREQGVSITDAVTPFPVHGLDKALGLKESRLHYGGFIFGGLGTMTALGFMTWVFVVNYPLNFDGKPHFTFPAMIPITFEFTVLCSAWGMFLTFLVINRIFPGKIRQTLDPRTTDNLFGLVFKVKKEMNEGEQMQIKSLLNATGAVEVKDCELKKRYY